MDVFNPLWSTRRAVRLGGRDIWRMAPAAAFVASAKLAAVLVTFALVSATSAPAFAQAQQTGQIVGTITDSTGAPLAGVAVHAAAPSSSYSATTDAKGFFALTGVTPDTYVVSFAKTGYQSFYVEGVSVVPGEQSNVSQKLSSTLKTIGRAQSRSAGAAFNPTASSDTYTVTESQINTILGKANNQSETDLLATLPGVTIDSSGYPVLRGGRENEEGFQFEGIDYTDAFTHQFTNSLSLNGQTALQLTPGSGDASQGNAGTGAINLVAKKGAYPGSGELEYEAGWPGSQQQYTASYGIATPNGRYSDYVSYIYNYDTYVAGIGKVAALPAGNYFGENFAEGTNFVNNFFYKWGKDNNQSFQIFTQIQTNTFKLDAGGSSALNFPSSDPSYLYYAQYAFTGLTSAQIQAILPLSKGQTAENEVLNRAPENYYQPNATIKYQYSVNLDPTTYITAKYFQVSSVVDFDFPYDGGYTGLSPIESSFDALQGGQRTGGAIDGTKQFGEKNLLEFGGAFNWLHPVYSFQDYDDGPLIMSPGLTGLNTVYDFVSTGTCPLTGGAATFGGAGTCGYLASQGFPNAKAPIFTEFAANANRQDSDFYVSDAYSPSTKFKVTAGLRLDGSDFRIPSCSIDTCLPTNTIQNADGSYTYQFDQQNNKTYKPIVYEPRLSFNYSVTRKDAVRLQYGRSVNFASIATVYDQINPAPFAAYSGVPAYQFNTNLADGGYNSATGTPDPVVACGTNGLRVCKNYADELYWVYQSQFGGIPVQPVQAAVFTNYEGSYSHDFGSGLSVKINPFYRDSTNDYAAVSTPYIVNGKDVLNPQTGGIEYNPAVQSNEGTSKTTGVEFYLTKDNPKPYGFSGVFSMTYINELSNVIPLSGSEDFYPSIPAQSLALGNLYRVGFLTPLSASAAFSYKTKSGLKINPIIRYNHGYPIGEGTNTATYVGTVAENVPNTNVTNTNGSSSATQYVDPQNPGTLQSPIISATRGTSESSSAGGVLSQAQARTDLDIEYTTPRLHGTFGLFITNLFNNTYGSPVINTLYQPVATGISGPQSGVNAFTSFGVPYTNYTQFGGNNPYLLFSTNSPLTFNLYYRLQI